MGSETLKLRFCESELRELTAWLPGCLVGWLRNRLLRGCSLVHVEDAYLFTSPYVAMIFCVVFVCPYVLFTWKTLILRGN